MSLSAQMVLQTWREKGRVLFYQKHKTEAEKKLEDSSITDNHRLKQGDKLSAWKASELANVYYEEVMNGGHEQFFTNHPEIDSQELVNALDTLRATQFLDVFKKALTINQSDIEKINAFDSLDTEFYEIKPELADIIEEYLTDNKSD
jgi:hypothetical protein